MNDGAIIGPLIFNELPLCQYQMSMNESSARCSEMGTSEHDY